MVIQIVVTIGVVLFILPNIYSSYKKKNLTTFGALLWLFFWLVGLVVIWFPELIGLIGELMGVERSIDALVYISIVYLLYVSLRQRIKLNEVHKEITMLSRKITLKDFKEDER
jgi:hypothetical protein